MEEVVRKNGKIVLIAFNRCTVRRGEDVLFRSEWGRYDMAVGAKVVSVFAGAADPERFHSSALAVSETVTKRAVCQSKLPHQYPARRARPSAVLQAPRTHGAHRA